jgi:hypothetical protein
MRKIEEEKKLIDLINLSSKTEEAILADLAELKKSFNVDEHQDLHMCLDKLTKHYSTKRKEETCCEEAVEKVLGLCSELKKVKNQSYLNVSKFF